MTQREKYVHKVIAIEHEDTQQSVLLEKEVLSTLGSFDLKPVLEAHCPLNYNQVKIYNPSTNSFVPFLWVGTPNGLLM